jgi:FixJ family two-component response regulator
MEHIVYVVDDDDAVRQSVIGLLESSDLNAIGFSSAEAFLTHRFEDVPACVILDMQMPAISGFDVADALKASGREIPIIFSPATAPSRCRCAPSKAARMNF